jgi:UDP-glucose 4-epimerase
VPEPSQLIPRVLDAALGRNSGLAIFGDDYGTQDGTCVRDFVHVKDLATAHVAAVSRIQPGSVQTFNLGVGRGASVREVIETCSRVTGRKIPFSVQPRRAGDAAEVVADPSLARKGLGWTAAYTDLARTIGDAWTWQSSPQFNQLRHGQKPSSES